MRRTEGVFATYGARSLLIGKFVPGLSTVAPPLAGIVRMPPRAFRAFSALGALLWTGVFVGVGWLFSTQLEVAATYAGQLGPWAVALLVAAIGVYLV